MTEHPPAPAQPDARAADAALAQRAAQGDRLAFAALVRRHQRGLFGFLGRLGLTQAEAEDLAQDTLVRAWQHLPRYRAEQAAFSTWLYTIAHRLALNWLDRAEQRLRAPPNATTTASNAATAAAAPADARTDATAWPPEPACPQPGPAEQLQQRQQAQRLHAALHTLSTADRALLALAYVHELPLAEAARIHGLSPGAAKARLHRARHQLKRQLATEAATASPAPAPALRPTQPPPPPPPPPTPAPTPTPTPTPTPATATAAAAAPSPAAHRLPHPEEPT